MTQATWKSVNTYYIQLEEKVGVQNVADMAIRLGVPAKRLATVGANSGSLTIGAYVVSPLDMATAYATLAAHGMRCDRAGRVSAADARRQGGRARPRRRPASRSSRRRWPTR